MLAATNSHTIVLLSGHYTHVLFERMTKFLRAIIPEFNLSAVIFDWLPRVGGKTQTNQCGEEGNPDFHIPDCRGYL